jgi:hypothetical protein
LVFFFSPFSGGLPRVKEEEGIRSEGKKKGPFPAGCPGLKKKRVLGVKEKKRPFSGGLPRVKEEEGIRSEGKKKGPFSAGCPGLKKKRVLGVKEKKKVGTGGLCPTVTGTH